MTVLFLDGGERNVFNAPGECPPPLDVHSRDVRAAPLPLSLPNSAAIDRGAVQVRAFQRVELRACEVQRCPELIGRGKRVEVRRVDEGVVTAGASEETFYVGFYFTFRCGRDWKGGSGGRGSKKHRRSLHIFGLAIQWKQMYTMIDCRSVHRSSIDASLSIGSSASLDRDGAMMVEKGHVTMVASGSMSSLATIESPNETDDGDTVVRMCGLYWQFNGGCTRLPMSTALRDETPHRET
jgi:hypothetical protein